MIQEDILLSICCFTYNQEKFIEYALKSFLSQQTNFRYEILIHDDASTDKTVEILKKYEKNYPDLIKVIYQEENQYSQGKCPTKNLYEIAQGKYLAICEGDDYWIDDIKLQKQVDFLESNLDYSATYHNVIVVDENNKRFEKEQKSYPLYIAHDVEKIHIENLTIAGQTASIVCKNFWKNLSEEAKDAYTKCKANGDNRLSVIFVLTGKIRFLEDIMSCYRRTYVGDSWNANTRNKNLSEFYFKSKLELKQMGLKMFEKKINPNVNGILSSSLCIALKKPSLQNIQIFCKIFFKINDKKGAINYILKKILKKLINPSKIYYWPLLENVNISEEVINGK